MISMEVPKEFVLVIIPTYNRAKLLPEALRSVLAQDYPHIRLVVVDDGSTDETEGVCRHFVREYPETISYRYKTNGGCASARNYGLNDIDETIGYVCFLDSDDQMMEGKLSRETAMLRDHPDAGFCYSDYTLLFEKSGEERLVKSAAPGNPDRFAIEHFLTNNEKPGAVLYRADLFADKRFDESFRYNEDSEFLQRVAMEHSCVYSPKPGCKVRVHPGAKSQNRVDIYKAVLAGNEKILRAYPAFYEEHHDLVDQRTEKIKSDLFAELGICGRWKEAEAYARGFKKRTMLHLRLGVYYRLKKLLRP